MIEILHKSSIFNACCSVTQSCPTLCNPTGQHARLPCRSPSPRVCSNACPLSQWCHPTISSSVVPFSSCLQSFPASETFPMSQLFTSGGQSVGAAASASVLPINIQDWFPLGWTHLSPCSPRDSQESSNTTVQKLQFFGAQLSLWSSSHIHTWLLEIGNVRFVICQWVGILFFWLCFEEASTELL